MNSRIPMPRKRVEITPLPGIDLQEFRRKSRRSSRNMSFFIIGVALTGIVLVGLAAIYWLPDITGTP